MLDERTIQLAVGDADLGRQRDLNTRSDIHDLGVGFYREVVFDDLLGPVFEDIVEVDWATHIPTLIDNWCRVLLGQPGYGGSVLRAHRRVHEIEALRQEQFDRWCELWMASIDERWAGPRAEVAKAHAARIALVLTHQLLDRTAGSNVRQMNVPKT